MINRLSGGASPKPPQPTPAADRQKIATIKAELLRLLTSDNPICSYDPRQALHARTPYEHSGEVELIFPISARMLVRGSSKRGPVNVISRHRDISDSRKVRQLNRTIAQFSYRLTIGRDRSSGDLIRAHARWCPPSPRKCRREKEIQIICRNVFGPRPVLSQYIDTPEKAARLEAKTVAASIRTDQSPD